MSDHDEIMLADLPDDFLAEPESFGKAQVRSVNKPTAWRGSGGAKHDSG